MHFDFDDQDREIAAAVRDLLEAETAGIPLRTLQRDTEKADKVRAALAAQGLFGLLVPDESGTLELGWQPAVLVLAELGRAALPLALLDTLVLAPTLLSGIEGPRALELLEQIALSETRVSVTLDRSAPVAGLDRADLILDASGGDLILRKPSELATTRIETWDEGLSLTVIDSTTGGEVLADRLPRPVHERAVDAGTVATAAMLLGLSERILELTRVYVSTREQFGGPVGAFQAVQHQLVDAYLGTTFAEPHVHRTAWSMHHDTVDRTWDASKAKRAAALAAHRAARTSLQLHGAMGYTHEYDLSVLIAREQTLSTLYGNAAVHTRRLTAHLVGAARDRLAEASA